MVSFCSAKNSAANVIWRLGSATQPLQSKICFPVNRRRMLLKLKTCWTAPMVGSHQDRYLAYPRRSCGPPPCTQPKVAPLLLRGPMPAPDASLVVSANSKSVMIINLFLKKIQQFERETRKSIGSQHWQHRSKFAPL